jgi:hypothetical protein
MLVICKYAYLPGCTNDCEHSIEHESVDFDSELMCNEYSESCPEVGMDEVICIPVSEFELQNKLKNIKADAKKAAKDILKDFEEI